MIRPGPLTSRCRSCGWSKTTRPKSDALSIGVDVFTICPKCGSKDIGLVKTPPLRTVFSRLKKYVLPHD